ncbi:hypothetical protein [Neorhizobium alkalisoli]|uniref:Uncharacterized protein n=1 Tax=Neorhizobium alkalisoli TaxID=528178 RepID=A0A561QQV0_9HYPH|nr:hypothetical protein [Neorhizobium alkalisoli]TWF52775.1 hypothetical protein FHW37_10441 [Neorhizobium alkalisoli]
MPNVSSRPPLTEDAANAIAGDIKSGGARGQVSEAPMAFQTPRPQADNPGTDSSSIDLNNGRRKKLVILGLIIIALIFVVWVAA